jgi:catechol 2,3-dioxygenase-like lactoylglutathione lyase family enzyme
MTDLKSARPVAFVLTRDRARTKPFYTDVLGLTLLSEDDFAAVYDLNGIRLRLTTVEDHVPGPHTVIGWEVPDIAATMQGLLAKGVSFNIYPGFGQDALGVWSSPDGMVKVCWFNDPEGNGLSLTQA